MRTMTIASVLLALSIILSCTQSSDVKKNPLVPVVPIPNTKDTISEYKFKKWTKAWIKDQKEWIKNDTIWSFSLPVVDLTEVLNENAVGSRFHLGLEKIKGKKSEIKLILVGVDSLGVDMVDYNNGHYYYDWSQPCPPRCQ